MRRKRRRPRSQNETAGTSSNGGRLVGWLVSYADDDLGTAHEIRSGRTLISNDDIGDSRVITVSDRSISTPHSALSASQKHRITIQDIFSESGTYLQRGEDKSEEKLNGPTEIDHGDWIRFGAADRYQLCLIDNPKR